MNAIKSSASLRQRMAPMALRSSPRPTHGRTSALPSSSASANVTSSHCHLLSLSRPRRVFHTSSLARVKDDYYVVLGVPRDAPADEVKKAYYKLAKQYHPDLPANKGREEMRRKFEAVSQAYEILGDEKRRSTYDKFGHGAFEGAGIDPEELFKQFNEGLGNMDPFDKDDHKDFHRGSNVEVPLTLTFEEAYSGVEKKITYTSKVECPTCLGTGAALGTTAQPCAPCKKQGFVVTGSGIFQSKQQCSACKGYGTTIADPCKGCKGSGTVKKERTLKVKIPAGVDSEHQVRLKDKGDVGDRKSGLHGTLYLALNVLPHVRYRRDELDIHVDVPITVAQAILGDKVNVETPDGPVPVIINAGTQPMDKRVLKGKGFTRDKQKGNFIMHFKVYIPTTLTKIQSDLIRQFGEDEVITPQSSQTFASLDRVIKFFNRNR